VTDRQDVLEPLHAVALNEVIPQFPTTVHQGLGLEGQYWRVNLKAVVVFDVVILTRC
jgi:hypothetical protein